MRPKEHYDVFHLPEFLGITSKELKQLKTQEEFAKKIKELGNEEEPQVVYCMCRKGNTSKTATSHLLSLGISKRNFEWL